MRFLFAAAAALIAAVPAVSSAQTPGSDVKPGPLSGHECKKTTTYQANGGAVLRSQPPGPKKLAELPPATTYMAVYRVINGCDAPLTLVEYRRFGRR
jgi:hypothetical protein